MSQNACIASGIVLAASLVGAQPAAGRVVADVELGSMVTSNVFLDGSERWDLALRPAAELGLDFAGFWSLGYAGELSAYLQHADLFSHWHQLYLFANPSWGERGENELVVEAAVDTLRNTEVFSTLNHVRPRLLARLAMEPLEWLRWQVGTSAAYRWFYDDPGSDSLDAWLFGEVGLALPTRTTFIPQLRYGFRYYPRPDTSVSDDAVDQQIEAGLVVGQGLWERAGLQLAYTYRQAVGESGLLLRKLTDEQFAYLGEEFFYTGHRGTLGLKQLLGESWTVEAGVSLEDRRYGGWEALDARGAALGEDRHDLRLMPRGALRFGLVPGDEASAWMPAGGADLEYLYLRQWSNTDWYDTQAHVVSLRLWASW